MILRFSKNFQKQYRKPPQSDFRHPSLKASKKSGSDEFEARVDDHNRFSYLVEGKIVTIVTVGPHDVGLGKK